LNLNSNVVEILRFSHIQIRRMYGDKHSGRLPSLSGTSTMDAVLLSQPQSTTTLRLVPNYTTSWWGTCLRTTWIKSLRGNALAVVNLMGTSHYNEIPLVW